MSHCPTLLANLKPMLVQCCKPITIQRNFQKQSSSWSALRTLKKVPLENALQEKDIELQTFGLTREKIEVDGKMINWDVVGHGEHVVLMLPGTLGTIQTDFGPLFRKFDKQMYTLVSWDPPGYGRSRPPSRDFSRGFQQRDSHIAVRLMEKLGFDKFSVMGWSTGGTTGIIMAADYPSKITKLVTMGAFSYADFRILSAAKYLIKLENWHPQILEPLLAIYGREYILQMLHGWRDSVRDMYYNDGHAFIKAIVPKVKCPTLIFHGQEDSISGIEQAEFLHNRIPNSKIFVIPKGPHDMHLRYTEQFVNVATRFIES